MEDEKDVYKRSQLIKLFSAIPPDWEKIRKLLEEYQLNSEELTNIAMELCNQCNEDYKRFATYDDMCENVETMHSNYFIRSLEILLEYGLVPDNDIDLDFLLYDLPYIKAPDVAAGALRLLLSHGANPNDRYDEDFASAFESLDFDVFYVIPHELNLIQSWMVFVAYGAYISDAEMPLTMLNGYSVEVLKEYELFGYTIDKDNNKSQYNSVLNIFNKQTKEMVARYEQINWDDYED